MTGPTQATSGPEHGWTRHGHSCCDQATGPRPATVARCGGPGLCGECSADVVIRHSPGSGIWRSEGKAVSDTSVQAMRDDIDRIMARLNSIQPTDRSEAQIIMAIGELLLVVARLLPEES